MPTKRGRGEVYADTTQIGEMQFRPSELHFTAILAVGATTGFSFHGNTRRRRVRGGENSIYILLPTFVPQKHRRRRLTWNRFREF